MALKSFLKLVAVAAALVAAGSSHAVITVYTTQASFLAAVSAPGVNTFSSVSIAGPTASPLLGTAGSYGFTGTVTSALATPQFFGAAPAGNVALSTNDSLDIMTFGSFTGGVRAAGGNFFGSDINGAYMAGNITLTATDAGGTTTTTITNATTSSFVGFVSNGPLTSFSVSAVQPAMGFIWPTVDNLTLAVAVPEPQIYALLFAGLGVIGFMARRRRGQAG